MTRCFVLGALVWMIGCGGDDAPSGDASIDARGEGSMPDTGRDTGRDVPSDRDIDTGGDDADTGRADADAAGDDADTGSDDADTGSDTGDVGPGCGMMGQPCCADSCSDGLMCCSGGGASGCFPDCTRDGGPDAADDASMSDATPDAPPALMCSMAQRDYLAANEAMLNSDSRDCALDCFTAMDAATCFFECMLDAPPDGKGYESTVLGAGRDTSCLSCISGQLACIRDNCLAQCFSDSSSMACISCRCTNDCYADFDACAGTTSEADACSG